MTDSSVPTIPLHDGNIIPQLGLGVWQAEPEQVEAAVATAIENGYRLIDTATVYGNEDGVGRAIAASDVPREELFITTKLWNSDQGVENVRPALENSLEKLGLDYVDLYLIHWPMPQKGLFLETWKELENLKNDGLIKSIGVSNFRIEDLETLEQAGLSKPVLNQIELHPGLSQNDLRAYAEAHDIRIESWSPIGGSKGNILENDELKAIADTHDKSVAQVILRWHIQHGLIVIPKSVHEARIQENIDIFDFELSSEEMTAIDNMGDDEAHRIGPNPGSMNNA